MEISNFKLTKCFGTSAITWSFRGTVDVSYMTGFLFWKRKVVETKEIYKNYGGGWYWAETGNFTPGALVESAERVWEAHNECKIEDYVFPKDEQQ